jgi:eukaryotic-like serine/threonine-protein kinase
MTINDNAAHALEGKLLKKRWEVIRKIEPKPGSTGGFFSVCYLVKDIENGQEAFLKALNFFAFFQLFGGRPIVEIINEQTNAFKYERELLLRCKNGRLSKVSTILDEGEEYLDSYTIANVPYLIFEMADGDVRSHLTFSKDIEIAWKLKSLHDVAVGLKQLHSVDIGHQDLKPSNILLYGNGILSKIGDLGRSLCAELNPPHDNGHDFPGDFNYAPPEYLYHYHEPDWIKRIRSTDMYLFGGLISFYFTGSNMTALIGKNIDPQFKWDKWRGTFNEVRDYLLDGFYKAINEFKTSITNPELASELSTIIEYCCYPIPENRGHPRALALIGNQYDFQRIITRFDVLERKSILLFTR